MKVLALLLWFAAMALLVGVLQMEAVVKPPSDALVPSGRSLLAIAPSSAPTATLPPAAVLVSAPVPAPVVDTEPVAGCSRLGVFPRRDWAERVAVILAGAALPAPVKVSAAAEAARLIEEVPAPPWRVQRIGLDAYYLQFDAWGIDELASRMTLQRALLKRLLSINAIPEAC